MTPEQQTDELIDHRHRLEAMDRLLKHHSDEIKAISKMQNRLLIALIVVTLIGSDAAAPVLSKLLTGGI